MYAHLCIIHWICWELEKNRPECNEKWSICKVAFLIPWFMVISHLYPLWRNIAVCDVSVIHVSKLQTDRSFNRFRAFLHCTHRVRKENYNNNNNFTGRKKYTTARDFSYLIQRRSNLGRFFAHKMSNRDFYWKKMAWIWERRRSIQRRECFIH